MRGEKRVLRMSPHAHCVPTIQHYNQHCTIHVDNLIVYSLYFIVDQKYKTFRRCEGYPCYLGSAVSYPGYFNGARTLLGSVTNTAAGFPSIAIYVGVQFRSLIFSHFLKIDLVAPFESWNCALSISVLHTMGSYRRAEILHCMQVWKCEPSLKHFTKTWISMCKKVYILKAGHILRNISKKYFCDHM